MSSSIAFFPYSWHVRDNEIHVYGFEADNQVAMVRLQEFTPYVYVKLPAHIDWTPTAVHRLLAVLKKTTPKLFKTSLMYKRPLYYAHLHYDDRDQARYDTHPYLFVAFETERDRRHFAYSIRKELSVMGLGNLTIEVYEHNATPVLQLTCLRGISTADWFQIKNPNPAPEPVSRLTREYAVNWKSLSPLHPDDHTTLSVPQPLILSYDIECNFHDPNKFSDGSHANDVVFQISCVFGRQSQPKDTWERYLLTLGNPDPAFLDGVIVRRFKKEFHLLMGFNDLVVEKNPQLLIGYNIFKFDIPFMYKRATEQRIHDDFVRHGCTREKCKLETIRWSSSAYSNQEMNFIDLQGRMTIDLLTLIQRDFNLENYKLDTVAEKFLGTGKDPLNHYDIFTCYKVGMQESSDGGVSRALGLVGRYCVKDSVLVLELFEKFQYWYSLTEMAKICQVPHAHLFLYGQQLKVFSQVYKYCYQNNIVTESGRFKVAEDDMCTGAYVFTPEPGLYDNVVSFDFCSLYPSIIISHNIDFTTLVPETDVDRIGRDRLTHIAWGEHINCGCTRAEWTKEKEIRCKDYSYFWLKEPLGVLPTIIRNLLDARKAVRKQMKSVDPNTLLYDILNKRQLAYKVSSNSMYGALTTRRGYLPFMPAGMCVTAVGRQSIERVSQIIQTEHQGEIVYGDSVTGETPILVRDPVTKRVSVRTIASLAQESDWTAYPTFRMFDLWNIRLDKQYALTPLEVWSDQGWTRIRKVIRHKTQKRLYTVGSARGVVCVTEDHSLLTANKKKIRPRDVQMGQKLLYAFPSPSELSEGSSANAPQPNEAYREGVFCRSRVPEHLFHASPEAIRRFIQGFRSEQFYPKLEFSDPALAQDFYLLLTRLGESVRIHTRIEFDETQQRVVYELKVESARSFDTHTSMIYEHPHITGFSNFVYDLETASGRFQAGVGQMIVKNTDSNYVRFPHLTDNLQAIWNHSIHVSEEVSKCFPDPMRLEFEEHIYARYLILSKKRYLYLSCSPEGVVSTKIENKGVLLKRRDNSKIVRDIYEALIRRVLERQEETTVLDSILCDITRLYAREPPPEAFQMSKSVKGIHGFQIAYRNAKTIQYGDYVVPRLKEAPEERQRQMDEKQVVTEEQFYQSHLPGAVQLALRMRARGQHIESGSRLSYVVTRRVGHKSSVSDKMEEIEYFKLHFSKQMIDTLHYLHLLINPVEEVLTVMYGTKYHHLIKDVYKYRIKYDAVMHELFTLTHPLILDGSEKKK
jgi:DNA polymerase elongation subunit (family B)